MNEPTDYKAAYLRQKAARERAERLLEVRSRELYDANIILRQQALLLSEENLENKMLIDRLSRVASQTSNGVVIAGLDGCVQWVNDSFGELLRRNTAILIGRPLVEVLSYGEPDIEVASAMEFAAGKFEPFLAEIHIGNDNKGSRWARVNANPLVDSLGTLQGYMAILVDITQIKQAEKLKREFTAVVSHELRTPLTSISGALSVMSSGIFDPLPNSLEKLLAIATRNCERLLELIEDLLDIDKLAAGKGQFHIESLELLPLLEQSIADLKPYADQYGVRLEIEAMLHDVQLRCDSRRFNQIMANLVSNAIKFSPHGCPVRVAVSTPPGKVRIEVIDLGPGIDAAFQHQVFQSFSQADSSDTRNKSGTGLGLAITRELVLQLGGDIGFESTAGAGTTFWLEWPIE